MLEDVDLEREMQGTKDEIVQNPMLFGIHIPIAFTHL